MIGLSGRTFIVTGGSSGIGRATCIRLAQEGAKVVVVARGAEGLAQTMAELDGPEHLQYSCDVTDEEAVQHLGSDLRESVGSVHGMVHCAGIHWLRPLQLIDGSMLDAMLRSHVGSSVALTRMLVGNRLAPKDGCSVVWMSSAAALQGGAGGIAYAAAKGALIAAARSAAVELARRRIRVNVVAPGVVNTPQSAAWLSSLNQEQLDQMSSAHLLGLGEPEDVAGVAAFLLSDDARWITGSLLVVDGGLTISP